MTGDVNTQKAQLRKKYLQIRKGLTKIEIETKSAKISRQLFTLEKINKAKRFLVYIPINNEVETKEIIDYLINSNNNIFLPANNDGGWSISEFKGWDMLSTGPFGTVQPQQIINADIKLIDVAILPGIAFDKYGYRLGYGEGVYDKLLRNFKGLTISLAFDFQIMDRLPKEVYDLKMDIVLSDKEIYDFKSI